MQRSHGRALLPEAVAAGLLAASWMRRATAESWRPVRAAALSEEVRQGGAARLLLILGPGAPGWRQRAEASGVDSAGAPLIGTAVAVKETGPHRSEDC
ncbi:hypothetical protein NDU88_004348 [Pleurodeles waltl]|uniref:Uncharacterized protein n=1 Tax=Pleurodeles waltl TaxID=8319 RepID=A0AAV7VG12_PLEWA|nr:hypothetical protein NDU88_004348 [Pleurodeles waltl]